MTTIEQKRVEYLTSKHADEETYTAEKIEFLVRTGLTFDPTTKKNLNGEEKAYKDIDWYYPKGAAFNASDNSGSDEPTPTPDPDDNTQQSIGDNINNPDNTTTVTTGDDQGNTTTEPLDPNSTVEPVTVDDGDDNPDNNPAIGTSDGEIIVTNDEP